MSAMLRNDLGLYERHAGQWWDARSRFAASLHGVNRLRLAHIAEQYGDSMRGVVVVDLGCGGGLVAEPLARLGASVVGIDISPASIAAATAHGAGLGGLRYVVGDARHPELPDGCADLVTCADLFEHIDGWPEILAAAARVLRPGGRVYVSTINRTLAARFLAVYLAEGLRIIPRGTHDPQRLIRPTELIAAAAAVGLRLDRLLGQRLRLTATLARWAIQLAPGSSVTMGYGAWLIKDGR